MILVAIGANLPGPQGQSAQQTCEWAAGRLAAWPGLRLVAVSPWFRSPAWPPSHQPDYVNGAAWLEGGLAPETVLAILHEVEAEAGRSRSVPNAARTLDLDLLAVDGAVVDTPALRLPHPRLHQRAFVLAPLACIDPGWRHPTVGMTVAEMLAQVDSAGVARLYASS